MKRTDIISRMALCCAILFHFSTLMCQTTFNKHYHFGLSYIQTGGVLATDDGYVYVGQCIDTSLFFLHWIIGKVDLNGEPICHRIYQPGYIQEFTFSEVVKIDDGNYLTIGNDSLKNIYAIVFDNNCDTVFTRKYKSEDLQKELKSIKISGLIRTKDGGYVAVAGISAVGHPQKGGIFKFDRDLNLTWKKYYGSVYRTLFGQVLQLENNNIIVFGREDDISLFGHDFTARLVMQEYSYDGVLEKTRLSESKFLRGYQYGVTLSPDGGSFITSSCLGREEKYASFPDSFSVVQYSNTIQKMDSDLNLIWETQIGHHDWDPSVVYANHVVASDSAGIVAVGQTVINGTDSTPYYQYGVISKVGWDGDSIWSRLLMADTTYRADHFIFNMDLANDGGYIMNGIANWREGWPPIIDQHLWLVKTDEYGCIVPGCHLISSVPPEVRESHEILVYPNPGSTEAHIFVSSRHSRPNATLVIVDLMGKVVYSIPHLAHEVTYTIDIQNWPTGLYYVQILEKNYVEAVSALEVIR